MSKQQTVQVALVGCGAVSQQYYGSALEELARHGVLEVCALCDPSPNNLATLATRFPHARPVADLGDLASSIELAIVASPPSVHAAQTIALLGRGMSVLCEKPMAGSVAEAEAMLAAAAVAPGLLAIGLFRRFFPATQQIRHLIASGVLGQVVEVSCAEGAPFRWPVQSPQYFKRSSGNGGVTLDIGVHVVDLLLWWLGEPDTLHYEDDAMGGIEANCRVSCTFANGARGEIRLSRDTQLSNEYRIRGTEGWIGWTPNDAEHLRLGLTGSALAMRATMHRISNPHTLALSCRPAWSFQQSFMAQIQNVVAAIRGDDVLAVPGEEGIRSLRVIETCYRQRSLLAMPWLNPDEHARARDLNQGQAADSAGAFTNQERSP